MAAANRRCHPCANARCHQNADPNDRSNDGHLGGTDQITELVIGNTIEAAVHLQLWPGGQLAQRYRSANGSFNPFGLYMQIAQQWQKTWSDAMGVWANANKPI